jgi:hypothetical protein
MKTERISINNRELGMTVALGMTEKLGAEQGLARKQILHLRLLTEELFSMLRSLTGEVDAEYWLEYEGKRFDIHMKSDVKLTDELRQQFLSASTSGENAAAKGVMGKLRVMIAEALVTRPSVPAFSLGLVSAASPTAQVAGANAYQWSMEKYEAEVKKQEDAESWDELEKSIVANIADEVSVRIIGANVEIIVTKAF